MPKSPLKIGFVGVGMMGQVAHLRNYASLPECQVVAVSDLRPDLARRVAQRYNVPGVYSSAGEMLENEELDALIAAQPFTHHGSIIPPLYQSNLPVFTEKPLASSIPIAERMLSELRRGKAMHVLGYHKRSDPAVMWARAEIERLKTTNELGSLRYVRVVMPSGDWVAGGDFDFLSSNEPVPALEADPPQPEMDEATFEEYVQFTNYYIHQVNLLRYLLGERYHVTYADPSGILMAVQGESGIAGSLEMTSYRTTVGWHEEAFVAFERGYIKIALPAPLTINRPGSVEAYYDPGDGAQPRTINPEFPWVHAMRQQAVNFLSAVRGESKPMCDAEEALEDLVVARDYIQMLQQARK